MKIFLSYSWKDKLIADAVDQDWRALGIVLVRDVRDLHFKQNVKDFMARVTTSDYVLVLISSHYLASRNCMNEALALFKATDFRRKVLPIVTADAGISQAVNRLQYVDGWDKQLEALNEQIRQRPSFAGLPGVFAELNECQAIRNEIEPFMYGLQQDGYASWPQAQKENYADIFQYIDSEQNTVLTECRRILTLAKREDQELALIDARSRYPYNTNVLVTQSSVLLNAGEYKKARRVLEDLKPIDPLLAHSRLGILLVKHFGEAGAAQHEFEQALALQPDDTRTLSNLGTLLASQFQNRDRAKSLLERALILEPDNTEAHFNLALLLLTQFHDDKQAQHHFEQALRLQPDDAMLLNNLGLLLARQQVHQEQAFNYLTRALELQPAYVDALVNLGQLLTRGFKRHDDALAHFKKALQLHPRYALAHYNLSLLLKNQYNDREQSMKHYLQAIAISPAFRNPKLDSYFSL